MKILFFISILLSVFVLKAQITILDYEPTGKIVKISYSGIKVFTDTTSFFSGPSVEPYQKTWKVASRKFFLNHFSTGKKDTIEISIAKLHSANAVFKNNGAENYVNEFLAFLIKAKKVKIIDKQGQIVKRVRIKKIGVSKITEDKGVNTEAAYINDDTNQELFLKIEHFTIME